MITGIVEAVEGVEDGTGAKADTRQRGEREREREIGDLFACNRSRV